jgi:hypothetical protein
MICKFYGAYIGWSEAAAASSRRVVLDSAAVIPYGAYHMRIQDIYTQ